MFYTVYKIINKINNKEYIGIHATNNVNDSYLGSGYRLCAAFKKYGKENFKKEILFIFDNPEDMIAKEAELVNEEYVKREDTYNLVSGGIYRSYISEITRQKYLACNGGENNPMYGKRHTLESRRKMSESLKGKYSGENSPSYGRKASEEAKRKMSEWKKNNYNGESNPFYGKEHSTSTKLTLSILAKERLKDPSKNPMYGNTHSYLTCEKCGAIGKAGAFNNHHNENCKFAGYDISLLITCPYCPCKGYWSKKAAKRYHFENCKNRYILNNNMIPPVEILEHVI